MSGLVSLDPAALMAAVQPQLVAVAEEIAADARAGYAMHRKRTPGNKLPVVVEADTDLVRVVTYDPLAHIDEWGGSGVHSTPTGAMRSAAAAHGRFTPE